MIYLSNQAYCSAMAHRIMELLNRLGIKEKFVTTGDIAKNRDVVKSLEKELGIKTAGSVWYKKSVKRFEVQGMRSEAKPWLVLNL
jgi:CO dehydrogenase nickel-insertion accessory protein CooC1